MAQDTQQAPAVTIVTPDDIPALDEMGEHYAAGFYEAMHEGQPRWAWFARGMRNTYERMPIAVPDDVLLLPAEPVGGSYDMATSGYWHAAWAIVRWNHSNGVGADPKFGEQLKQQYPQHAELIDRLCAEWATRCADMGSAGTRTPTPTAAACWPRG